MTILDDIAQALDKMANKYERDAAHAETYERTIRLGGTAKVSAWRLMWSVR